MPSMMLDVELCGTYLTAQGRDSLHKAFTAEPRVSNFLTKAVTRIYFQVVFGRRNSGFHRAEAGRAEVGVEFWKQFLSQ